MNWFLVIYRMKWILSIQHYVRMEMDMNGLFWLVGEKEKKHDYVFHYDQWSTRILRQYGVLLFAEKEIMSMSSTDHGK